MNWFDILSLVLNVALGGGLFVTIFTLRSVRRKAQSEADSVAIANNEKAMQLMQAHIVEPIIKEVLSLRVETARLRKAIDKISGCKYGSDCPVQKELTKTENENEI